MFEGKMMTNREILSKINQSGGGVSFDKGGNVSKKEDCGCGSYDEGGDVSKMKQKYPTEFSKGVKEETREHRKTFKELKKNKISLKDAVQRVVAKHLSDKPNYYKNYEKGGHLKIWGVSVPSLDAFILLNETITSPFIGESSKYRKVLDSESEEHLFYKDGDKNTNPISNLLAYETYLYDHFGIVFSELPAKIRNGLTLGSQKIIDQIIK